jgi:hypothetical protein
VTLCDVISNGGSGLMKIFYENSLLDALRDCYKDSEWQPWKFGYSDQRSIFFIIIVIVIINIIVVVIIISA